MDGHGDRRMYQRAPLDSDARISADGAVWRPIEVTDLSSGGLRMRSQSEYRAGDRLFFEITLYGLSTECEFKAEGVIKNIDKAEPYYFYGVSFLNLPVVVKIDIDEIITHTRPREYVL